EHAIANGLVQVAQHLEISSAHVLFPTEREAEGLVEGGMFERLGMQYQWHNRGYETFEHFLAALPQKRRTQIRRERKALAEQGITIETVPGSKIDPPLIDAIYDFYTI